MRQPDRDAVSPPTAEQIRSAAERIAPHVRRTPVLRDGDVVLKLELLQHTGSFKPRGAVNRVLTNDVPAAGLLAASGGNAGLAVAYTGRRLGHRVEVFVPSTAPAVKVDRLRGYGAEVHLAGGTYADAFDAAQDRAAVTGALFVHAYDQPEVVTGQGTVGLELEQDAPELETVLVAVGGGGLIGGVASWYAGRVAVVAVEAEGSPTLQRALAAGEPVDISPGGVASDALGARRVGGLAWSVVQQHPVHSIVVSGEAVLEARRWLWDDYRLVAEPGGATALAALRSGAYRPAAHERVGVIVCGGNSDPSDLAVPQPTPEEQP